jgi:hypothetical protein
MIQRIQTVYLALSLILLGLMAMLPLGEIAASSEVYDFSIKGVFNEQTGSLVVNGWPLIALLVLMEIIQVSIIFGYKNRIRQIRLATLNILLMVGLFAVSFVFIRLSLKYIGEGAYMFRMAMSFPLVAAILNYLAIRAIGKDEALVRSVDRIR